VLLVAATERELCGQPGLVCGIGPVEAAAAMARELERRRKPLRVLNVGVAGGRGLAGGTLVVGTESVYCDISAAIPVVSRLEPDQSLLTAVCVALPHALHLPIGTSARVNGPCSSQEPGLDVEGMEGFAVLRACELAGIPALEVRAISNEIGEGDRSRWEVERGLEALAEALPRLVATVGAR
jgi:nucleoside phosphorylase